MSKSSMTSVWLPADLAARLDALAARAAAGTGVRFSKSGWIVEAIRRALSDAAALDAAPPEDARP